MYALYSRAPGHVELVEMTMPEFDKIKAEQIRGMFDRDDDDPVYPYYEHVDSHYARKWVKDGKQHMTTLYVDIDGKVRKAKE